MSWYCDSSALFKLMFDEAESGALRLRIEGQELVTSELGLTELARAAGRMGADGVAMARALLEGIELIRLSEAVLSAAGELQPPRLRTLDAIHLASALLLGSECQGVVTYDIRMREAAELAGLAVVSPG